MDAIHGGPLCPPHLIDALDLAPKLVLLPTLTAVNLHYGRARWNWSTVKARMLQRLMNGRAIITELNQRGRIISVGVMHLIVAHSRQRDTRFLAPPNLLTPAADTRDSQCCSSAR